MREDNQSKYREITRDSLGKLLYVSTNQTHTDVARYIYEKYKHEFKCSSITHSRWYHYYNNKWNLNDRGNDLKKKISSEVAQDYADYAVVCSNKSNEYKEEGVQLIGYYVNNGEIYETEIYKDIVDIRPKSMTVKRYDSEMNLIDDQETENAVESSEWSGNKEIINIALENGLTVRCLKKTIKNHSSLIVRRDSEGSVE
jgi:hypothetical protein